MLLWYSLLYEVCKEGVILLTVGIMKFTLCISNADCRYRLRVLVLVYNLAGAYLHCVSCIVHC